MGKKYPALDESHVAFIQAQKIFFVGTAGAQGRVNVSPKGMDSLRILAPQRVAWLNLTGSGNETAAHVREQDRMTLMFCAFDGPPMILRLYGHAKTVHSHDDAWPELAALFPAIPGARQIFEMTIDLVQTSCGFGVPMFEYHGERDQLVRWAENKGEAGLRQYWEDRNQVSLDGKPTGILD